jgi:hypothetical protein
VPKWEDAFRRRWCKRARKVGDSVMEAVKERVKERVHEKVVQASQKGG